MSGVEFEDDDDFFYGEESIIGYECIGCGNVQDNHNGFGCDVCTGHYLEPIYN